ncbi:hypothetical protein [Actinokineospora globicatena]|uniref:Uncharacterized protein n=1 Tax=Actinokineospora globicatena TaxID=103729 RepID=A0A9W6QJG7_9PSEU|nr:hypothetical protein [Actinokineospora globicatena]GLW89634.1 hypothetical protein Aglo03_04500 [Actinokineospora globicatena]
MTCFCDTLLAELLDLADARVRVVGQPVAGWIDSGNLKPKPNQKIGGSTERC